MTRLIPVLTGNRMTMMVKMAIVTVNPRAYGEQSYIEDKGLTKDG